MSSVAAAATAGGGGGASGSQPAIATSTLPLSPVKAFSAAIDALVAAFDKCDDVEARNATLCALLPARVTTVLTGSNGDNTNNNACSLFGAQGCPHARQLQQFDLAYADVLACSNLRLQDSMALASSDSPRSHDGDGDPITATADVFNSDEALFF